MSVAGIEIILGPNLKFVLHHFYQLNQWPHYLAHAKTKLYVFLQEHLQVNNTVAFLSLFKCYPKLNPCYSNPLKAY